MGIDLVLNSFPMKIVVILRIIRAQKRELPISFFSYFVKRDVVHLLLLRAVLSFLL